MLSTLLTMYSFGRTLRVLVVVAQAILANREWCHQRCNEMSLIICHITAVISWEDEKYVFNGDRNCKRDATPVCNHEIFIIPPAQRSCWVVYWFHFDFPSVRRPSVSLSLCPTFHVCSVTPTVLDGFFPYWAWIITSMRRCVMHYDLWPWPISSRSFSHDWKKTATIWHILSCPLCSTYSSGWILFIFRTNDH